jgi:hypothetical protein
VLTPRAMIRRRCSSCPGEHTAPNNRAHPGRAGPVGDARQRSMARVVKACLPGVGGFSAPWSAQGYWRWGWWCFAGSVHWTPTGAGCARVVGRGSSAPISYHRPPAAL